jgi:tetratricopeptide (TPR) repeat protein
MAVPKLTALPTARITDGRPRPLPRQTPEARIGDRVRQLRVARGMTQSDLGGDRFTKAYVSQLERGRARPSTAAVEWLALRLNVSARFLEAGVEAEVHERAASAIVQAEAANESSRHSEALSLLAGVAETVAPWSPDLEVRALLAEGVARMELGQIDEALGVLGGAERLASSPPLTESDRAAVLFRQGCCRYKLSSTPSAIALFSEALELADRSGQPSEDLRCRILRWRSRCHRRLRDWEAAREDLEEALRLAARVGDDKALAHTYFQASLVAERRGKLEDARSYAERAKVLYERTSDELNVGRLLNNLGVFSFELGDSERAIDYLERARTAAEAIGSKPDAGRAVSSLAQVHLRTGNAEFAEVLARRALELIDGRVDFLDEIGNAQLVLGRALLADGQLTEAEDALKAAEASFVQLGSPSHQAAARVARGDLAARRGEHEYASQLYRKAAESLQDFRF